VSGSGYEPDSADVMLSAGAPALERCLAEAVRAMVAAFASLPA
jgi:hypothetical protein